jgi:hypothetical protein
LFTIVTSFGRLEQIPMICGKLEGRDLWCVFC